MPVNAIRPPTAQQFVLDQVRRMIITGDLRPGVPIRQTALSEQLGVSRVPLREALKILEGEGQVSYHPHRGYCVAELSIADLVEIYRIRRLLESEAARVAVDRIGKEDMRRIVEAQRDIEAAAEAEDVRLMTAANRRFHFALLEASGMPHLVRLIRLMWDATDAYRVVYVEDTGNRRRVEREHRAIIRALKAKDADRLVALLDDHREHTVRALQKLLVG